MNMDEALIAANKAFDEWWADVGIIQVERVMADPAMTKQALRTRLRAIFIEGFLMGLGDR